jgi:hypothetical protein
MLAMISMVFRLSKRTLTLTINIWITFKGGVLLFVAFVTLLFTKLRLAYQKTKLLVFFSHFIVLLCLSN